MNTDECVQRLICSELKPSPKFCQRQITEGDKAENLFFSWFTLRRTKTRHSALLMLDNRFVSRIPVGKIACFLSFFFVFPFFFSLRLFLTPFVNAFGLALPACTRESRHKKNRQSINYKELEDEKRKRNREWILWKKKQWKHCSAFSHLSVLKSTAIPKLITVMSAQHLRWLCLLSLFLILILTPLQFFILLFIACHEQHSMYIYHYYLAVWYSQNY